MAALQRSARRRLGAMFAHAGTIELHYITGGAGTLATRGTIFTVAGGTSTTYKN